MTKFSKTKFIVVIFALQIRSHELSPLYCSLAFFLCPLLKRVTLGLLMFDKCRQFLGCNSKLEVCQHCSNICVKGLKAFLIFLFYRILRYDAEQIRDYYADTFSSEETPARFIDERTGINSLKYRYKISREAARLLSVLIALPKYISSIPSQYMSLRQFSDEGSSNQIVR